jgi:hypothetical protein
MYVWLVNVVASLCDRRTKNQTAKPLARSFFSPTPTVTDRRYSSGANTPGTGVALLKSL